MEPLIHQALRIGMTAKKGRGVFATASIAKDTIIEIAPVIELSFDDTQLIQDTKLYHYYFIWGSKETRSAIALGFGSIYNHSYEPNVVYEAHYEAQLLVFKTLRQIEKEEELLINYNCDPSDRKAVWFDAAK